MTKLEQAQELVQKALGKVMADGGRYGEEYIALRTTLEELEEVYELEELCEESKHNLQVLGFEY